MVEQAPVLPPVRCLHMLVYPLHLDHGALHGLLVAVHDDAPQPGLGGLHVGEQRLLVVFPLLLQLPHRGPHVLAAVQLQGDLHAVGEVVVEVLHATLKHEPLRSVGDSALEVIIPPTTLNVGVHGPVLGGVQAGQGLEDVVVRCQGLSNEELKNQIREVVNKIIDNFDICYN